jgi:hypothetical protein
MLKVNCNSYLCLKQAGYGLYSTYRDYLIRNRYVDEDNISVIPIMSIAPLVEIKPRTPKRIGFVARDFAAKGGVRFY